MKWERIEAAFAAVIELPPNERKEYLDALRREDEEVAREVDSLLSADDSAAGFLDRPLLPTAAREEAAGLATNRTEPPIPETIGPYRVLSRLGAGGMSQVFLGERTDGEFSHRVAIKLIRAEIVSDELIRRFETERQILAQLAHPNIAGLLDGGRTEDGLPFLVMEYVDGLRIDEYCDRERLTIDERLALFLRVCSAVQYAHRNLIVHRDIKAGNILVTTDGTPKLLDFGIAKLLSPESFPLQVERTATRLRPMTPYYASPEQIENGPITTATDVYSLGVLLYWLLAGRFPYDFEGGHPRAVEEKILSQPVVALIHAINGDKHAEGLATMRSTTVRRLRRMLAGDSWLIVGMALRKEPERRYQSVEQLAADIVNSRRRLPVSAHADSLGYRLKTLIGRNQVSATLSAALFVILVAFSATMTLQAQRIKRERDLVQAERDRGDQVIDLLHEVFSAADPMSENTRELKARDVLEAAAARVRGELVGQPLAQAELLVAIGNVLRNLGFYAEARSELAIAASLNIKGPGSDAVIADTYLALGLVQREEGRLEDAKIALAEAARLYRAVGKLDLLSEARGGLASVLRLQGNYEAARSEYQSAIDLGERAGLRLPSQAVFLNGLGILESEMGSFDVADTLLKRALRLRQISLPAGHPLLADSLNDLAVLHGIQGHYGSAQAYFEEAYEIRKINLEPGHPLLALSANNLARVRKELGDFAAAESLYQESIGIVETRVGRDHPDYATCLHNLGMLYLEMGRLEPADDILKEALEIRERAFGADHLAVGRSLSAIGRVKLLLGDYSSSETLLREAIRIQSAELGKAHWRVAEATGYLGENLAGQARTEEARPMIMEAHSQLESALGSEHRRTQVAALRRFGLVPVRPE